MKSFYQIIATKRCNGVRKDAFITELLFHFIPFLISLRVNEKNSRKEVQPINETPDQINGFPSSSENSTILECKCS